MHVHRWRPWGAFAAGLLASAAALAQGTPPVAPVRDQVDTWHGVTVHDPYRYMEDLQDPQVKAWAEAQGRHTRGLLDRIEGRAGMEKRLLDLDRAMGDRRFGLVRSAGGAVFYLLRERQARQVKLAMRERPGAAERVLVDPGEHAQRTGVPHAVNWFVPSWDGRYVAYGLSAGGSEDASMHILDLRSGRHVGDPVPRVPFGGVSWLPDSGSVAFNQLRKLNAEDAATETYLDTAVHVLRVGAPADQARAVFGPTVNRDLGLRRLDNGWLVFAPGSPWVVAATNDTTQREGSVFVARVAELASGGTVPWQRIASFDDHLVELDLKGHDLYYRTKVGAPRFRVMKLDLRRPDLRNATAVAEAPPGGLIESFDVGRDAVLARVRQGTVIGLRRHLPGDVTGREIRLPFRGAAAVARDPAHAHADFVYTLAGWTQPAQAFRLEQERSRPLPEFGTAAPNGLPAIDVHEVLVRSHDGTAVPMTILHRKGLRPDGSHPTLLRGYGSYGLSETANFSTSIVAGSRRRLCRGQRARQRRLRRAMARGRQPPEQVQHLEGRDRLWPVPGRQGLCDTGHARHHGRQCRGHLRGPGDHGSAAAVRGGGDPRRPARRGARGGNRERHHQHLRIRDGQGSRRLQGPVRHEHVPPGA